MVTAGGKAGRGGKGGGGGSASSGGGGAGAQGTNGGAKPAPRITGKLGNMSVHTQLKLVERYRSLTAGGAGSGPGGGGRGKGGGTVKSATVERTGFRKTKDDAYQEELARRRAAKQSEARHLDSLKAFTGKGAPPVLLVDGYNICGCEEGAAAGLPLKDFFKSGDLESAQKRLVEELDNLALHKGYRVVVVFDADRAGATMNGVDTAEKTASGVWVVFSTSNDADSWIERASLEELEGVCSVEKVLNKARLADAGRGPVAGTRGARATSIAGTVGEEQAATGMDRRTRGARLVYVATNDNALSSVVRGNGAYVVSAGSLVEEMTRAREAESDILRHLAVEAKWKDKRGSGMLAGDSETADKLMAMYLNAPNASTTKFVGSTAGFSSKPKKGKKNKSKKK